jgi:hypothetical protein
MKRENAVVPKSDEPVCWLRTLNGEPDWSEDCVGDPDVVMNGYAREDGYDAMPLYGLHSQGIVREMCDACEASDYVHRSIPVLVNLIEATADTLSSHKEITDCCTVTRQRVEEAKALLREFRKLPDYLETRSHAQNSQQERK